MGSVPVAPRDVVRRARVDCGEADAVARLCLALGDDTFDLVLLFVSPDADFPAVVAEAQEWLPEAHVVACTTAGEISGGYTDKSIVALGFPAGAFRSRPILVRDVSAIDGPRLVEEMIVARHDLICAEPEWDNEFDFLLIDGLSTKEDELTHHLAAGLGGVPLFGGSAGDGTTFRATFVSVGGVAYRNAAVLTLVRTRCPIRVFKTDHLRPTAVKMVVTEADPARRMVREINAEPAAREYARILGKDPDDLSAATFAAHPVLVRMGEQHHVRAIQRVTAEGELVFFCAIDEGLVLTLAQPEDMVAHLQRELGLLAEDARPDVILACDCILRRQEAENRQLVGPISRTLAAHRVFGFSTYGEQVGSMHVNQTLTGVAIYAPERPR